MFRAAAESGHPAAHMMLSSCYKLGRGVQQDLEQAYALIHKAADLGEPAAQFVVGESHTRGEIYARGDGVKMNVPLGKRYLELSAGRVPYSRGTDG